MIVKKSLTIEIIADEKNGEILAESCIIVGESGFGVPEHLIDASALLDNEDIRNRIESMDWSCEIAAACDGISDEDYAEAMADFKSKLSVAESGVIVPMVQVSKQYYQR